MITFKKIELEDREILSPLLVATGNRDCNLSFVNLYSWQFLTRGSYAVVDGTPVIRFVLEGDRVFYHVPAGSEHRGAILEQLMAGDRARGDATRLFGVFPALSAWLDEEFPGKFRYRVNRDSFDYIYARQELVDLKGKDFQAKRNHVNKFTRTYAYDYAPLTPDLVSRCLALEEEWYRQRGSTMSGSLSNERKALTLALQHARELDLLGGVLRVEGKVVAFTYGTPLTGDTFNVHIEKADSSVDGAYNMINRELARRVPVEYLYINREEDLGLPGLRKAKLSYRPRFLLEKGFAELLP
ncbi:MAG: phosphatidylglycerol lysyltransferase domain-containing protein [Odoribacteraceae bacterium]|jgi:hypothetical protein|nr:phosphatidylglycerol lysyltransferase domain-containing protein [Odoribacteraceae bacterium]